MRWVRRHIARLHPRTAVVTLAALAVLGVLGAAAVVGLGLYNVSAHRGHLPGVSWMLATTFENSVRLRAGGDPPPADLRSAEMVALGAGHYATACTPCHAAPGQDRSATVREMKPEPPHIVEAVKGWNAAELHWIVREGVKMTGMPGWPSDRADEVWPVVAFLLEVDAMTAEDYRALTAAPAGADELADADGRGGAFCTVCHNSDGVSDNPRIPRLDILSEEYILRSLLAYRSGARDSGIMEQAMSLVDEAEIAGLAAYFARNTPEGDGAALTETAARGRDLAYAADPAADVPACRACHGPWPEPRNALFPSLAGQYAPYLRQQLRLWRDEQRGGGPAAELMRQASRELTDEDIAALAAYYAALAPAKEPSDAQARPGDGADDP
ncbi:c-type cytochrome [Rhodobacteraceae bacterium 2CG4]|uniref:C-type cytochrome n=1 Tax=Halovulum marinum TaxID=2662447 RepID=A0A6L5YZF9_9RHOB|nr:c-type cytochrome [Halovulum marinum]MSU89290.1 c-type cytochrome [Halovulum marinum]